MGLPNPLGLVEAYLGGFTVARNPSASPDLGKGENDTRATPRLDPVNNGQRRLRPQVRRLRVLAFLILTVAC